MNEVHYDWSQDVISSESPPPCGDLAVRTQDLDEITCDACKEYLRQAIEDWVQTLPPPPSDDA